MNGDARTNVGGKRTEEEKKSGGVMKKGAERLICAVGRRSVAVVKSEDWRKIGDALRPCVSRRKPLGRERWQRDNARKIKLRWPATEIDGLTSKGWRALGQIRPRNPSQQLLLHQFRNNLQW
jgi:hypothetical protein